MRKIKIFEHISLDGVIEHGQGTPHGEWTVPYRTPAGLAATLEAQGTAFDLLLGRRTYDLWTEFWPKAAKSPMSDALNAAIKYVVTHRPDSLTWGPVQASGQNLVKSVRDLKSKDGVDVILWGSSTLTSVLIGEGLVDEMVLIVYPVLLGSGKRLFSDSAGLRKFTLVSTKTTPTGVLLNTYRSVDPTLSR